MKLNVPYQESFSRGLLLLRSFFGIFYIFIPHFFLLFFVALWSAILGFISWWIILFTGRYPQSFFEFQVGFIRWSLRLSATQYNLTDKYPAFGTSVTEDALEFEVDYPEQLSRGLLLVRTFFGWLYVLIPHGFILLFRSIWGLILTFLAWWVVLFTGSYPRSWHEFNVGTLRWNTRVNLYISNMTDEYPPFSSRE